MACHAALILAAPAAPDDDPYAETAEPQAEPTTDPSPEAAPARGPDGKTTPPEPTAQERAEIERALGSDASARAAAEPAATVAGPSGEGGNVLGLVDRVAFLPDITLVLMLEALYGATPHSHASHEGEAAEAAEEPEHPGFGAGAELELALGKSVDPYFRMDGTIGFSLEGVDLEEAFATTLSLPWNLQARAGYFLTQFGRLNPTHRHAWTFAERPLMLAKAFGAEGNRGLGLELAWLTPLPWYVEILGSSTLAAGEGTARSFYGADDLGIESPIDLQNTLAIKQFFDLTDDWSLLWGLSVANGPNSSHDDARTDVYGADLYLKYRPITRQSFTVVSLQTEWLYRRRSVPGAILQDTGGYAELFWRFAQRWGTAGRYELTSPTVDSSGAIVVDPLDPAETDYRHRASLGVWFWPTEFSRLGLESALDAPLWLDLPRYTAMLTGELSAGVHGAHKF